MCTDDHAYSNRWYCDAILNQNLDAELRASYQNDFPESKVLSGVSYCLFREELLQSQALKSEWVMIQSLLVTLGGSDPENATKAVLCLLNQACMRSLHIRVLVGADNAHIEELRSFDEGHHQVEIVQNATNMAEQYAWADGIISAGGALVGSGSTADYWGNRNDCRKSIADC